MQNLSWISTYSILFICFFTRIVRFIQK